MSVKVESPPGIALCGVKKPHFRTLSELQFDKFGSSYNKKKMLNICWGP